MRLAPVVFLLCSFAAVSPAQVGEISLSMGESLFKDSKLGLSSDLLTQFKVANGFRIGARLTLNTKKLIGHEFGYAYSRSKLGVTNASDEAMPTHQGFYDFLFYV